ncbi:MAG: ATPase [Methanobacterium sp.]
MEKEEILTAISQIRREIGHENLTPDITDVIFDAKKSELLIIASDRPEKSLVIGKGGWVVGKLKEELKVDHIHVEAYSDILLRKYRMELALKRLGEVKRDFDDKIRLPLDNLSKLLENRIEQPYNLKSILEDFSGYSKSKHHKAMVALSGGVDSSFSLIVAEKMGFHPLAVTVNPGDIILPKYLRDRVETITGKLDVEHRYLDADMSPVIDGALEGRYHPCGRCSKVIEETILDYAQKEGVLFLIFGDLLATGAQSSVYRGDVLRISLPAMLSATKGETKALAGEYGVISTGGYGCPLLAEVKKRYNYMSRFSVQRVLRETRAGILEPGEALDMVMSLCRNKKD